MKILCLYLPQYHETVENNAWWGEGYTEWTAVKRARPLYKGHYQPKIPLDNNYYDLSDESAITWEWQAKLANKYGVYGFCVYHYWFKGKKLLEKPLEILLKHPEIEINYSMCWANETWTKTWYGLDTEILMEQEYGVEKDWQAHFNYLVRFFKDERYIKIDNKPMITVYRSHDIEQFEEMIACWNIMAKNNGFDGVYIVAANTLGKLESREDLVDAYCNFEPGYSLNHKMYKTERLARSVKILAKAIINKCFNTRFLERCVNAKIINKILVRNIETTNKPVFRGAFPLWDNTPRRGYKGMVYKFTSPELFYKTLMKIKEQSSEQDLNFIYINAWNEWGEGCYLEPEEKDKYKYLEVIKEIVLNNKDAI